MEVKNFDRVITIPPNLFFFSYIYEQRVEIPRLLLRSQYCRVIDRYSTNSHKCARYESHCYTYEQSFDHIVMIFRLLSWREESERKS